MTEWEADGTNARSQTSIRFNDECALGRDVQNRESNVEANSELVRSCRLLPPCGLIEREPLLVLVRSKLLRQRLPPLLDDRHRSNALRSQVAAVVPLRIPYYNPHSETLQVY